VTDEVPPHAVVRVSPNGAQAEAWSLVLLALNIPHEVEPVETGYALVVPVPFLRRALKALDAEDAEAGEPPPAKMPDLGSSSVGVAIAIVLVAFFAITGPRGGADAGGWFRAGSGVAERILHGEWWRVVTALTLHSDWMHAIGNGLASILFVSAVGRWLGGPLALLATLLSGAIGNAVTALVYRHSHDVVGASTATFGALGLLVGLQVAWRIRARSAGRIGRSFLALAVGLGLLAMLGTQDSFEMLAQTLGGGSGGTTHLEGPSVFVASKVDLLAHAAGFAAGIVVGLFSESFRERLVGRAGQAVGAVASFVLIVGSWWLARGRL
jgi:rhomboid protease GluP